MKKKSETEKIRDLFCKWLLNNITGPFKPRVELSEDQFRHCLERAFYGGYFAMKKKRTK